MLMLVVVAGSAAWQQHLACSSCIYLSSCRWPLPLQLHCALCCWPVCPGGHSRRQASERKPILSQGEIAVKLESTGPMLLHIWHAAYIPVLDGKYRLAVRLAAHDETLLVLWSALCHPVLDHGLRP